MRQAVLTTALLAIVCTHVRPMHGQELGRIGLQLLVTVPTPPVPVQADGKPRLVYELHVTNAGLKAVTLDSVEAIGTGRLALLEGDALAAAIRPTLAGVTQTRTIAPASHVVVLLWLTLDAAPSRLSHRLVGREDGDQVPMTLTLGAIEVDGEPVRLAPPLRGDRWLAANGPANDTHHRRSWLARDGRAWFPERFAIDFVRLHGDQLTTGDPTDNRSYRGYGEDVLAVANATVAAIVDGIPDNVPANRAPPAVTPDTMGGNLVVLDLGNGRHAFYAHLQPGSIRVRQGDRVTVGQPLARVGNSGNSNAPHLHFQVSDGPSLLFNSGLPFVFDAFEREGRKATNELPLKDWIVSFSR
jgi:hypothetical protein